MLITHKKEMLKIRKQGEKIEDYEDDLIQDSPNYGQGSDPSLHTPVSEDF
jgi:hypothetical protein